VAKKIINLSDVKNEIDFQICNKTFTISRLTIEAAAIGNEYIEALNMTHFEEKEMIDDVFETQYKNTRELKKLLREKIERIAKKGKDDVQHINTLRKNLISKILSDNGYEYDSELWEHEIENDAPNRFIIECLKKDTPDDGVKKGGLDS